MRVGNRCKLLSITALAAAMTIGIGGGSVAQDATPTAMGDDDAGVSYVSHIHGGNCDDLSAEPVQRLADLMLPDWVAGLTEGDATEVVVEEFGNAPIPVAVATTEVPVPLTDIVAGNHAVVIERANADDPESPIACGNIGGVVDQNGDLFVGLDGTNETGHYGVVWLHASGAGTTIVVFLAHPEEAAGIETALGELTAAMAEDEGAATPQATPGAAPLDGDEAEATPVA